MATSISPNLKLVLDPSLNRTSRSNLLKIDTLGSLYQVDTSGNANVRSLRNINIVPNSQDIGGTGTGGTVSIGSPDQEISSLQVFADSVSFSGGLGLSDTATGGQFNLNLIYKSDLNNATNSLSDVNLTLDLDSQNRNLILASDLSIIGEDLTLNLPFATNWTLPPNAGANGQVLTTDGAGILTWTDSAATTLGSLTDVDLTGLQDNQFLQYNLGTLQWEPVDIDNVFGGEASFVWTPGEGSTKTINHSLNSQQIIIQVLDTGADYQQVDIPETTRPDNSTVILNSTEAPSSNWVVLLKVIN